MATGPVDPGWIDRTAREQGFGQAEFERAYRLAHLLSEIAAHPWLSERLALKGGTAINFFHTDLARLSVDLDLNYIGSPDLEVMEDERDRVIGELTQLVEAHGYECDPHTDAHASWGARFLYTNSYESGDSIKADVNLVQRVPLYDVRQESLPDLFELSSPGIPCLAIEELYGGKISALATRAAPRDVYDAAWFFTNDPDHDTKRLRKAFLFHTYLQDATLETVDLDRIGARTVDDYETELYPMLRGTEDPSAGGLSGAVLDPMAGLLDLGKEERAFGERLEDQAYEPDLLFGDVDVSDDIEDHPGAEWRRRNPHGQLPGDRE
jgi:predicted nucleotidyltransferase component of viral defense system